jgi:hypothetical protein
MTTRSKTAKVRSNTFEVIGSNTFEGIVGLLLDRNMLHWHEIARLACVKKGCHNLWNRHKDNLLEPLLHRLDSMAATNKHNDCHKVYAPVSKRECTCHSQPPDLPDQFYEDPLENLYRWDDPRYSPIYDDLQVDVKCKVMVQFLEFLKNRMHSWFDFTRLSVETPNIGEPSDWSRSLGTEVQDNTLWDLFPNRATLALNIATLSNAQRKLEENGSHPHFDDAFRGTGKIYCTHLLLKKVSWRLLLTR